MHQRLPGSGRRSPLSPEAAGAGQARGTATATRSSLKWSMASAPRDSGTGWPMSTSLAPCPMGSISTTSAACASVSTRNTSNRSRAPRTSCALLSWGRRSLRRRTASAATRSTEATCTLPRTARVIAGRVEASRSANISPTLFVALRFARPTQPDTERFGTQRVEHPRSPTRQRCTARTVTLWLVTTSFLQTTGDAGVARACWTRTIGPTRNAPAAHRSRP